MQPEKDWATHSNIIWSNGKYDPWSMGGILSDISPDMKVYLIDKGAHHFDLHEPKDTTDPNSVKDVRRKETETIR